MDNNTFFASPCLAAADLPYLISFPRTGSHWLRMFLEQYFDRPLLTRWFFPHDNSDFLLLHRHDHDGEITDRRDTVYLYRGVVNTIFSQLTYDHRHLAVDLPWEQIKPEAFLYRCNLQKWLVKEDAARRKHVVAYEWLLDRPYSVLPALIEFLGSAVDESRMREIWQRLDTGFVAERTTYNDRVMTRDPQIALRRELFRYRHGRALVDFFREDSRLCDAMDPALLD